MARSSSTARLRSASLALLSALLVAVTGCSGGGDDGSGSGGAPSSSVSDAAPLPTHTTFGVVSGKLDEEARARLKERITEVVDDWFDAAYLDEERPRTGLADDYPHFTPGAARDARGDAGLMSNAAIADRLDAVEATKRRLRIDVLAVKDRAAGVTARFVLGMRLAGEVDRTDRVAGSLFLTWRGDGWQVFGYDVQRETT